MFNAVFFDLDGTLMDFKQSELLAFTGAFAGEGHYTSPEMYEAYCEISRELWGAFEKGLVTQEHLVVERFRRLFERFGWDIDPVWMNNIYIDTLSFTGIPYDGAVELLDKLHGRMPIALVTNGIARAQRGRIRSGGLERYFDHVFISEEMGVRKPDPAYFKKALAACGIEDASSVIIVGDSLSADMKGGVNSGLKTCWYNPGRLKNTLELPVDYEVSCLSDIIPIVLGESL